MTVINNIDDKTFTFNGIEYYKNFISKVVGDKIEIINVYDSKIRLTDFPTLYSDIEVDGVIYGDVATMQTNINSVVYSPKISQADFNDKTDKGGYVGTSQDLKNAIDNAVFGDLKTYQTLADFNAVTPVPDDGTPFIIANDPNEENNGQWSVQGGVAVQNARTVENVVEKTNTSKGVSGEAVDAFRKDVNTSYFGSDLFSPSTGFIDKNTGALSTSLSFTVTQDFQEIQPDTDYIFNIGYSSGNAANAWYDKDKVFIEPFYITNVEQFTDVIKTSPSNAYFVRCSGRDNALNEFKFYSSETNYNIKKLLPLLEAHQPTLNAKNIENSGVPLDVDQANQNALIDTLQTSVSLLEGKIDELTDDKNPLFINMSTFTKYNTTPSSLGVVNVVSRDDDYTFTVNNTDISTYTGKDYVVVIKDDNGIHKPYRLLSVDTSTGVIKTSNILPTTLDSFMPMFDAVNGQHLSNYGYNAMAEYIYDKIERYEYLKRPVIYKYNPVECTNNAWNDVKARSLDLTEILADFNYEGGATNGGFVTGSDKISNQATTSTNTANPTSATIYRKFYTINQRGLGKGVSLKITTSNKTGYAKVFVGVDNLQINNADANTLSVGTGKLEFFDNNGVSFFSQEFKGASEEINVPLTPMPFVTMKVTCATSEITCLKLSGVYVYEKRDALNSSVFENGDVVAFLGDSWTQFPNATGGDILPKRPDGVTDADGMQFLSERLKSYALENGVTIETINQGRSGMTSAWGKYWLKTLIIDWETKPKYCIINFSINDKNSQGNVPSTPSGYDFDSDNPWTSINGDVFGSVDLDGWLANIKYISDTLLSSGIKPIILMPSWTASFSQSADMITWDNYLINNF